jgi:hypothetical protein
MADGMTTTIPFARTPDPEQSEQELLYVQHASTLLADGFGRI